MTRSRFVGLLTGTIALALLLLSPSAKAAMIIADGTVCTLADAIDSANDDAASGGCTAGQTSSCSTAT